MSSYQSDCFGFGSKEPYCLIYRDGVAALPLVTFWILIPIYVKIVRRNEPQLKTPKFFWAHLTIQALLLVNNAIFGAVNFNKFNSFQPFLRFVQVLSYVSCCLWFCLLSKRLHSIHPSFPITFWALSTLKFVHLLILIFEKTWDLGIVTDFVLVMAETALLSTSRTNRVTTTTTTSSKNEKPEQQNGEEKSSIVSKVFFCWLNRLIAIGAHRSLESADLPPLTKIATSDYLMMKWREEWKAEKEKKRRGESSATKDAAPTSATTTEGEASLVLPFYRMQKKTILTLIIARLSADVIHYLNPFLLKQLIDYVSLSDQPLSFGIAIGSLMFLCSTTRSLLMNFQIGGMCRLSSYYQTVLNNALLEKILHLSPSSRAHRTAGEILNFAAVDTEIICHSMVYLQNMWSVPFQVTLAMIALTATLGTAAVAGVATMLLFVPLNYFTSRFIKKSQIAQMKVKDERTKLSNELLNGIKVVKLYAWEESFEQKINKLRAKEVRMLRNVCILSRIVDIANATSPFLVAVASFTTFILFTADTATSLTPSVAFVALTIFNQLRQPMRMVAMLINTFVQAKVSNNRLRKFMNEPEMTKQTEVALGNAIIFKNATLNWKGANDAPILKNLSATIKNGQLVAIVGSVGAGKTSFLSAILDEMIVLNGRVKVGGTIGYVPQHSWIFNKSIRENVMFGDIQSQLFYEQIIKSCQLESDLAQFENGDETIVGENGITLSGGQKARVSLARAIYQDADIYLLDDPLSAVDAHVGRAIFDDVIGDNGLLRHKTRVLVTHNLSYTKFVDVIYVIEDGQIVEHGTFDDLAYLNGPFGRLYAELNNEHASSSADIETMLNDDELKTSNDEETKKALTKKTKSNENDEKTSGSSKQAAAQQENVQLGRVKKDVYLLYLKKMGIFNTTGFVAFFVLHFLFLALRSFWLSSWSNENATIRVAHENSTESIMSTEQRLIVYAGIGGIEIIFLAISFTLLTIGSLRASYGLHAPLIHSLLHAPITFFDVTPIGRIINRLSRDLDVIDKLQDGFRMMTQTLLNACMIIALISIATPIFLIVVGPLVIIYYIVMKYFVPTARQLKRLESANRSPILSTIAESIHGASTIRAFDKIGIKSFELSTNIDKFAQCRYLTFMSNRWLATRLELLGNTVVLFASLSTTVSTKWFGLTPGLAGLSVSYALTITEVLNMCVRQCSEIESNIVSVERVNEYQNIESEAAWNIENCVDDDWPSKGKIELCNYSMKYRDDLPLVLNDLSLTIEGGEKIGIIGRTGSGKSSLTMSLYRMIESFSGCIRIDGVDISKVGLHQLRRNLIIIPQEPVVFSGTLRFNIDPFDEIDDDRIWKCLDVCQLRQFASEHEAKLDQHIAEGGKNMSQGERQLLCLCRAILRQSKIVILDEATASVDPITDSIVQKAIRTHFPMSTTISIAHRLDTIADSDRILVLESSRLAEFDTPSRLLQNPESLYSQLLNEKNRQTSDRTQFVDEES